MENQEMSQDQRWRKIEKTQRRGKIIGGLLIVAIGSLFLAKELGAEIPEWIFSWKVLLICLGIVTAVKHKFMHPGWLVLVIVGTAFLLNDMYPDMHLRPFLWPVLIILAGLFVIFKPRRREMNYWKKWHEQHPHFNRNRWHKHHHQHDNRGWFNGEKPSDEEYIDATSFMGAFKKNVLTKTFKGGDVVNIFGGAMLNLSQADFEETATLEITQVFGGTKLIVPANWEIKSETVTICGGIEDKRPVMPAVTGEKQKVLILVGTTIFGGIEIKSFE